MDYPLGFPSRFRPRLEAAVLRLRHKFPLAGDALKRINETLTVYIDIACGAIDNAELEVGLAHTGLQEFALELCEDHANNMAQAFWTDGDWDEYVGQLMSKLTSSKEWLGHLNRLDALAEKPSSNSGKPSLQPPPQVSIKPEIRGERDPTVAARRAELRNMLRSGKKLTSLEVCKRWDSKNIKVPESWGEEGITTWQHALRQQTHRSRVKKLVSKDSKFIKSHN